MSITTIGVSSKVKQQLEALKGDMTFNEYLQKLITAEEGAIVDDINEIKRPQTALTIEYIGLGGNLDALHPYKTNERHITFQDLKNSNVGDVFEAEEENSEYYTKESAEVMLKDNKTCLLRVEIETNTPEAHTTEYEMIHIELF